MISDSGGDKTNDPMLPVLAVMGRGDRMSSTRILAPDIVTSPYGGQVSLECVVTHSILSQPPAYFTW